MQVYRAQLDELFPAAQPQDSYHELVQHRVTHLGFTAANTIACVGVCRDELTSSFVDGVQRRWGEAFHLGSLAGMVFLGKTGVAAAIAHAPAGFDRHRFLFFALPHVGLGEGGEVGVCVRPGQHTPSTACGALAAFRSELLSGHVSLELDPEDLELSLLRRRLYPRLVDRPVPSLAELTELALEVILEDLERAIALTVDPRGADYAVLTGIQIHAPVGHLVWPGSSYAVIAGQRQPLALAEA